MKISELFTSLQGEGQYAGIPTIFIRFFGCPLRCTWCDSKYTWDSNKSSSAFKEYTEQEIIQYCLKRPQVRLVCITGGDPLAEYNREDLRNLVKRLSVRKSISVETSGAFSLPGWQELVDSWVWDIKLPGSGEYDESMLDEVKKLGSGDQVKFVVKDEKDLLVATNIYKIYNLEKIQGLTVLWSPVYNEMNIEVLAKTVIRLGANNRLSLQMHKQVWGEKRGY